MTVPQPFLIVATERTGSTFLAHALSNHPQVFCDRGESLHHRAVWRHAMEMQSEQIMRAMFSQRFYRASGFKVNCPRIDWGVWSWPVMREMRPHIILLTREDKVRQAISLFYLRAGLRAYPNFSTHSNDGERLPFRVRIEPIDVLRRSKRVNDIEVGAKRAIGDAGLRLFEVTYEQMTGGGLESAECVAPDVAQQLCEFLGVDDHPLCAGLKKVSPRDLADIVSNWDEIQTAVGVRR